MAGVTPIVLALVQGRAWGWTSGRTLGAFAIGAAVLAYFVVRTAHHPRPLIDLALFRLRSLRVANMGVFVMAIAWFSVYWAMIQLLINDWAWSPLKAGLLTAPVSLGAGASAMVIGRLAVKYGHRRFILPGSVVFGLTGVAFWRLFDEQPSVPVALFGSAAMGLASGSVFPSFIAASLHDVPVPQHAVGSGFNFMIQRIGTTVGVALAIGFLSGHDSAVSGLRSSLVLMIGGAVLAFLIGLRIETGPAAR